MSTTKFEARCNLSRHEAISALPHYLRREYEEKGYRKAFREVRVRGDWRRVECFLIPLCDGLVTNDPAEFERHMLVAHSKKPTMSLWPDQSTRSLSRRAQGKWRAPRLKPEGAPLSRTLAEQVQTCPSCGLHAETPKTYGDELWWREHLDFCVAEQAAS